MTRSIGQSDIGRLGRLYAERVLRNARLRPEDMPELARRVNWLESGDVVRRDIVRDITDTARGLLLAAGYGRELVRRILQ